MLLAIYPYDYCNITSSKINGPGSKVPGELFTNQKETVEFKHLKLDQIKRATVLLEYYTLELCNEKLIIKTAIFTTRIWIV